MKCQLKVTRLITLLSFLVAVTVLPALAQNTAPVPTTFEILSPSDGNLPLQLNHYYGIGSGKNNRIFYGGDLSFRYTDATTSEAFKTYIDAGVNGFDNGEEGTTLGNAHKGRLTLGTTESYDRTNGSYFSNLPGTSTSGVVRAVTSFDNDDFGDGNFAGVPAAFAPDYSGNNGLIAINEEDTLEIRLTGYVDPNNEFDYTVGAADGVFTGRMMKSISYAFDIANPTNDSANGVRFGIKPSTLPQGASFNGNILHWVPNFIQGDGTYDNSVRNTRTFVDANISNGSTASGLVDTRANLAVNVGPGLGELKDSLYVIYFTATDDGIPPSTGMDSLFVMVNDSIENPGPLFSSRRVVNRQGQSVSYTYNSLQFPADSLLNYSEGDSLVATFFGADQDSVRGGGTNQRLSFTVVNWDAFMPSNFTGGLFSTALDAKFDSVALDTASVLDAGGNPRSFRVRLQLAYNLSNGETRAASNGDTLVIQVADESGNVVNDTMLVFIGNVNRFPIWDADTTSRPSDSSMVFSYSPAVVYADSIDVFSAVGVSSGKTDTLYFSRYVYDPDPIINDQLGTDISYSHVNAPSDLGATTGLMVLSLSYADTVSIPFTIKATDSYTADAKTANQEINLRVAPEPDVAEVYPPLGYAGQDITIFGSGFGLFDPNSATPSRVIFRARNANGSPQNDDAVINSWSRDRINITIPRTVPQSDWIQATSSYIPDTIEVYSAVFSEPTYYPYIITPPDTTRVDEIEVVNLTSTSAVIKWKTIFTGADSVIVASVQDTLDVFSTNFAATALIGGYWPTFVIQNNPTGLTANPATATIYRGSSSNSDQLHYVQLTDLTPSTTYQFILGMKDNIFFGDSAHQINGPYYPKKIDRTNGGATEVNSSISGFRFQTLPEQNSNGATHALTGKVYTDAGAARNALVTLQVISANNVADTSMPLTAVVGTDSSWVVNLGDAVVDTLGVDDRAFPWQIGDYLLITVVADKEVGYLQWTDVIGSTSPQVANFGIGGSKLTASVEYDLRLKTGLNLIGLPVDLFSTEPDSAEDLLDRVTAGSPSITKFNSAVGTQQTRIKAITSGGGYIGDANFSLKLYEAYFLAVDQMEYVTLKGSVSSDDLNPIVFPNAALYWISRPAQTSDKYFAWSARTMLTNDNIPNASVIYRFNEDRQQYETAIVDPVTGAFVGEDFHIDVSEGYILQVTAASQWDPNTPGGTALANAEAQFSQVTGTTPSLVLNTDVEQVTGAAAVRNVRLTDVTSSAARLSWLTNVSGVQVRYGKATEGLNKVAMLDVGFLGNSQQMSQLLGLEPETEYVYELAANGFTYNNNGRPFTFRTAPIGIGLPYTIFGRMVDESGMPLTRAMVYVELKNSEQTSTAVSAVTDENGYWNVNLANLKVAGLGSVYEWKNGDDVRVTAVFENASTTFRTSVSGQSPQNIIRAGDTDGVAQENNETAQVALPKAFGLAQNYPNPFNPSTTISFDIPEDRGMVSVELKVFNLRGQLVRSLVNEGKPAGHYMIQWDGMDEHGEHVSSGVYFYRIKAGDYVSTRKMVLLK